MCDCHCHCDSDAIKSSALESYGGWPHTLSAYNTLTLKGIGDNVRCEICLHPGFLLVTTSNRPISAFADSEREDLIQKLGELLRSQLVPIRLAERGPGLEAIV